MVFSLVILNPSRTIDRKVRVSVVYGPVLGGTREERILFNRMRTPEKRCQVARSKSGWKDFLLRLVQRTGF